MSLNAITRKHAVRRLHHIPSLPLLAFLLTVLAGCATLPKDYTRTETTALPPSTDTLIYRAIASEIESHPGLSGVYPLGPGLDALVARLALADAAERSIDVQYYIWHRDTTGTLMMDRLLLAADRGVRVRLLLDDIGTAPKDSNLLAIDAHPNVEVRLFNPVASRSARMFSSILDFGRVNRRMHNKSFTVDNEATIVGGRNIGDEYFEAREDLEFADLDIMAVGPVVRQVSDSFDLFWNSPASVPIRALTRSRATSEAVTRGRQALRDHMANLADSPYLHALETSDLARLLQAGRAVPFLWGRAWTAYDDPSKAANNNHKRSAHLLFKLTPLIKGIKQELLIVSPYFVPGKAGVKFLSELRRRGVRVRIVTNSLASNDVGIVHAGYARYRKPLLRAGIELYEARPRAKFESKKARQKRKESGLRGSSRASLHAKTFVFDRRALFVGSLNLDPRSIDINTEIGVIVENETLASEVAEDIEHAMTSGAFRLALEPRDPEDNTTGKRLVWIANDDGQEYRFTSEPEAGIWRRLGVWLMSLLPIESQL